MYINFFQKSGVLGVLDCPWNNISSVDDKVEWSYVPCSTQMLEDYGLEVRCSIDDKHPPVSLNNVFLMVDFWHRWLHTPTASFPVGNFSEILIVESNIFPCPIWIWFIVKIGGRMLPFDKLKDVRLSIMSNYYELLFRIINGHDIKNYHQSGFNYWFSQDY